MMLRYHSVKLLVGLSLLLVCTACGDPNRRPLPDNYDDDDSSTVSTLNGNSNNTAYGNSYGIISDQDLDSLSFPENASFEDVVGDTIYFPFNGHSLSESAQRTLLRQAKWLKDNKNVTLTIEGHCDERGTREYNLALGEKRANAVKNYLIRLNVNPLRIDTISYGKERPAVLGSDEATWSKNRRAITVITRN